MRPLYLLLLCLLFAAPASAQDTLYKFRVEFTDKANNPYSLANPEAFLSEAALLRRAKHDVALTPVDLPITPQYLQGLRDLGAKIAFTTKWFNAAIVALPDSQLLSQIKALPYVKSVEYAGIILGPLAVEQQASPFSWGDSFWQVELMNGQWLHQQGYTGAGILIAVIDAGFPGVDELQAFSHLFEEERVIDTYNIPYDTSYVYTDNSHGTIVLGAIAGILPGLLRGTAPDANFLLLRSEVGAVEYDFEEDAWAAAAEFADSAGAWIINSSLGYHHFHDSTMNYDFEDLDGDVARITQAADLAAQRGILVVTSAGNAGQTSWQKITAPADGDSVLSVGAVDSAGELAGFSSIGPTADGRIKPDIVAPGVNIVTASLADGETTTASGTSLSSPLVTGLAACLWQAFPHFTNMQIREVIIRSAGHYFTPDTLSGHGIPDFFLAYQIAAQMDGHGTIDGGIVQLYPNPFTDWLRLTVYDLPEGPADVTIVNMLGEVVYDNSFTVTPEGMENWRLDVSPLAGNNFYVLVIRTGESLYTQRILKVERAY